MLRLLVAILVGVLISSGCTGSSASPDPGSTSPHPTPSPTVTVAPAALTPSPAPVSTAVSAPLSTPTPPLTPTPTTPPTPRPTWTLLPGIVPPKPTGVTFDLTSERGSSGIYEATMTVTWRAPRTAGVEIRVFGVTECLSMPSNPPPGEGPCLVVNTPLPASVRKLLAVAPATDGSASLTWPDDSGCSLGWAMVGPEQTVYRAVVLAAYSATDHSIFAIAEPGSWSVAAPGDIVC